MIEPIRRIAAATKKSGRQTLLFSATMPRTVAQLAASMLNDPAKISVTPVSSSAPKIEQGVYLVNRQSKQPLLEQLLKGETVLRAVVFTRTKHGADRVGRHLERAGIRAETIHGNKGQNQRTRALAKFSTGGAKVLVATDVAARGLDVDGITHVFNFDLPVEAEAYVHRIGRTGRAGASGIALSFCDGEERPLLRDIQKLTGKQIPVIPTPVIERSASADLPHEEERAPRAYGPRPSQAPRSGHAPRPSHAPRSSAASHHPRPAQGGRPGTARPKTAWRGAKKSARR